MFNKNNIEEIKSTSDILRKRILSFRETDGYDNLHPAFKHDVNTVEICDSLTEIFLYYRNLTEDELRWFTGGRFIEDTFGEQWVDITDKYKKLCDLVKSTKIR